MTERRYGGLPPHEEMMEYLAEVFLAPITYARELKEKFMLPGNFLSHVKGAAIAAIPILIPLAFGLKNAIFDRDIPAAILSTFIFWTISGVVVRTLHTEGVIGPPRN